MNPHGHGDIQGVSVYLRAFPVFSAPYHGAEVLLHALLDVSALGGKASPSLEWNQGPSTGIWLLPLGHQVGQTGRGESHAHSPPKRRIRPPEKANWL